MDILGSIVGIMDMLSSLRDNAAHDAIKKKHKIRLRFYTLLKDYINSPGEKQPSQFFAWYLERLDDRMKMAPQWMSFWYKITRGKNESTFRKFLQSCQSRAISENVNDVKELLKVWIPDDEHRILQSSASSDLTQVLNTVISIAEDKQETQEQIQGAITSNIPLFAFSLLGHWFFFNFVYDAFVTPGFEEYKTWEEMTLSEQGYMRYVWIMDNGLFVVIGMIAIGIFLAWSIKNWHKRSVFLREHYVDYLPPYSLAKTNEQYNILMIMANFMKNGKSFTESLEQVKMGSSPYIRYQVDKILLNDTAEAQEAINTFYLGDYGSDIRDRAGHISLAEAMNGLLPSIKKQKKERFDAVISWTMKLTIKPIIYLSFAASLVPIFMEIFQSLPTFE